MFFFSFSRLPFFYGAAFVFPRVLKVIGNPLQLAVYSISRDFLSTFLRFFSFCSFVFSAFTHTHTHGIITHDSISACPKYRGKSWETGKSAAMLSFEVKMSFADATRTDDPRHKTKMHDVENASYRSFIGGIVRILLHTSHCGSRILKSNAHEERRCGRQEEVS